MANQLALNGETEAVEDVSGLYQRIEDLESELRTARQETLKAKRESEDTIRSITALRAQLMPLHRALRAIFGEINLVIPEDAQPAPNGSTAAHSSPTPASPRVWDIWKQKLPGKPADVIQALQEHGEMNVAQIRVAAHCGQQTVYDVTSKLFKLGLLNKNGGKYSLKAL